MFSANCAEDARRAKIMPMAFEWIITEPTCRKNAVIAQTKREAIERFSSQTGISKSYVEGNCKVERGGRV